MEFKNSVNTAAMMLERLKDMAILYDINNKKWIAFYFYKDMNSHEWIKYQIVVNLLGFQKRGIRVFNEETANTELFLECSIEPEIPELIKELRKICEGKINIFKFEPIDDRDFCFLAFSIDNKIKIDLTLKFSHGDERFCIYTNIEKLLIFSTELENEYKDVINGRHGLIPSNGKG